MEAGHPERAIEENQQELAAYMSTEGSNDITANAALWAYHTMYGILSLLLLLLLLLLLFDMMQ